LFFFQKETERRKLAETTLEEYQNEKSRLEIALEELKKQNSVLQEKNKEVDELVNDLSDELELEKGLREEMKIENENLEKALEELTKAKDKLSKKIDANKGQEEKLTKSLATFEQMVKDLEAQLQAEKERSQKLGELYEEQGQEYKRLQESRAEDARAAESAAAMVPVIEEREQTISMGVELEEIVIDPANPPVLVYDDTPTPFDEALTGKILSIDTETEFVIVDMGTRDGLTLGNILSVYRNDDYIGDIKITRLQSEMSAADLIMPLSISKVRKNDQVKTK